MLAYIKKKCFTGDDNYIYEMCHHVQRNPVLISCERSHCNSNNDHIAMRNKNAVANNDRLWIFKMRFFSLFFFLLFIIITTSWKFKKKKNCGDRCVCGKTRETIIIWLNWAYSQFCGNSVWSLGFGSIYPIKLWFSGQKYRGNFRFVYM